MSKTNRIDFQELREQLEIGKVLEHYQIELETLEGNPDQLKGICPLTDHEGEKTRKQFSLNQKLKVFQCHGCKARGSILDLICLMEGCDPMVGVEFRQGIMNVAEKLLPTGESGANAISTVEESDLFEDSEAVSELVNAPLDFALQLDGRHACLDKKQLGTATTAAYGLGYASRGRLKGRLVAPLQDTTGCVIGYAGLALGDEEPRWLYPDPERVRDGTRLIFDRGSFVYNLHRFHGQNPLAAVVVTEDLESVWRLHEDTGIDNIVSVMGDSLSNRQVELIDDLLVSETGRIVVAVSSPEENTFLQDAMLRLGQRRYCRWVALDGWQQWHSQIAQ